MINLEAAAAFAHRNNLSVNNEPEEDLPTVQVPSDAVPLRESAISLMEVFADTREVFRHHGKLVTLSRNIGKTSLIKVDAHALRTLAEKHALLRETSYRGRSREPVESPSLLSLDHAKGILACKEALDELPEIKGITSFPLLKADGTMCAQGYDPSTGIFVAESFDVPQLCVEEAVCILNRILVDYRFATPSDHSRGIATLLSPMLRMGPWLGRSIPFPIFLFEADASQTGKSLFAKAITTIYNEIPSLVTQPHGGVGSLDESFGKALLNGRAVILLDNIRGRVDSPNLESFTTAGGEFYARGLKCDGYVDSRYYIVTGTSNGFESTADLSNRMSVIRILHQEDGHRFHPWTEGSLLEHLTANRSRYLGAIIAVFRHWMAAQIFFCKRV